eukprot:1308310-Pyramimonas_sp.AAC.1
MRLSGSQQYSTRVPGALFLALRAPLEAVETIVPFSSEARTSSHMLVELHVDVVRLLVASLPCSARWCHCGPRL